jgi:hypothetical protein
VQRTAAARRQGIQSARCSARACLVNSHECLKPPIQGFDAFKRGADEIGRGNGTLPSLPRRFDG